MKRGVTQTGHIPLDLYRLQSPIARERSVAHLGYTGGNDHAGKRKAVHQSPFPYRLQILGKLDFRQGVASGKRTPSQRFQRLGEPDLLELLAIHEGKFVKAYQALRKGHLLESKAVAKSANTGDPLFNLQPQDLIAIIVPRSVSVTICCYGSGTGEDHGAVGGKYPCDVGAVCLRAAVAGGENVVFRQQCQVSFGGLLGGVGWIGRIGRIGGIGSLRGFRGFRFPRGIRHLRHFRDRRGFRGEGGFRGFRGRRGRGLGGRFRGSQRSRDGRFRLGHFGGLLQLYSGSRGVLRQGFRQNRGHQLAGQHQCQQQGEQFFHRVTFPSSGWLFPDVGFLACIPVTYIIPVNPGNCKDFFVRLYKFCKTGIGNCKELPKERKKPSPVNQGKAGKRPHPALRATFPSQGKALYGAVQSHALRGKYVLARRPVGPTWLPPLPSGGTSPIGSGKALMGIFLSLSVFGTLHFPGNVQCLPQEEVRPSVPEQQHRHPQQQLGVAGRVVQGQTEVTLHPANPIEHRVPVSKKHLAGLFQGVAAG